MKKFEVTIYSKLNDFEKIIDRLEPAGDIDRFDNGDGLETGMPSILDRIYNSVRRMPLRKMIALTTFIFDLIITLFGLIYQYEIPNTVLTNWDSCKIIIYGFYFGSSAIETIADSRKNLTSKFSSLTKSNNNMKKINDNKYIDENGNDIPIVVEENDEP